MRSLFAQLWLAFLLVVAMTFTVSLGFTYAAAVKRSDQADQLSVPMLARSAQQELNTVGIAGVESWLVSEIHRQPEIEVYFVDRRGREILGRKIKGQPLASAVGSAPPVVRAPDGTAYRLVVRRVRGVVFDFWRILFEPWILTALILVMSGIGCALLAWFMSRPVRRLRSAVRTVASGNLDVDIDEKLARRQDELGGLARDFGQMTFHLHALLASREELLRDVSHELRSPLARLKLAADLAEKDDSERAQAFRRIEREVERIDALIGQMLHFSKVASDTIEKVDLDLSELLEEAVEDARLEADQRDIGIELERGGTAIVTGSARDLRSAIENVLRNAVRHAPPGTALAVRLSTARDSAIISVRDEGAGAGDGDANWVFEPFRRGEGSVGAGLGLSITKRIIEQHGGNASAANLAAGGFCVDLSLPKKKKAAARPGRSS
ncbi:MAG TPA: HAMP domain-containing sensor histidine kinase [Sphingomicrobium sp.]|nr:HAMP domain-containing sensor histidine kinase [Sphingomicrobium sp.]